MHGNKSPHMLATKVIWKMMTNRAVGPFDTGCKDWVSHTDCLQQWFIAMMSRQTSNTWLFSVHAVPRYIGMSCHKSSPGSKTAMAPLLNQLAF